MWLARRGRLIGLLCWTGALFFVFYNSIVYVFAVPPGWLFLLQLTLVVLSVYTLIALLTVIDTNVIQQRLTGAVPERLAGGVLAGLGLLFFLRVVNVIVSTPADEVLLSRTELAVSVSDFLIAPAWVIGGILLWRRKPFGYLSGLG